MARAEGKEGRRGGGRGIKGKRGKRVEGAAIRLIINIIFLINNNDLVFSPTLSLSIVGYSHGNAVTTVDSFKSTFAMREYARWQIA